MFNRQLAVLAILILALVGVVYWLLWPTYLQISAFLDEVDVWQKKVAETEAVVKNINLFEQKYKESSQIDRTFLALPQGEDVPGLLVQVENLATINGFVLNSVDFVGLVDRSQTKQPVNSQEKGSLGALSAASASSAKLSYRSLSVSLKLSGRPDLLYNLLKTIEENLRIMDVKNITFNSLSGNSALAEGSTDFTVDLTTYYK